MKNLCDLSLVALDTEGEWNRLLLENAAAMSNAGCVYAATDPGAPGIFPGTPAVDEVLGGYQHIIACEAVRDSVSVYDFPAPRGKTAVLLGNEQRGIPRSVLKKADRIIAVPMTGAGMSSINVAAAGAVALYALSKDFGRKSIRRVSGLGQRDVDVFINAPDDPHELGSLLRSVWSFGWRRVFVADPHAVWFTKNQALMLEGRAAARRAKNPLAILPASQFDPQSYDQVLLCGGQREGTPLSRLRLPPCHRLLVVYGHGPDPIPDAVATERVYVDQENGREKPRFRNAGSILLSVVSEILASKRRDGRE